MPGAIVIAEPENRNCLGTAVTSQSFSPIENRMSFPAGIELLGESVLSRLFQALDQASMKGLSLLKQHNLEGLSFETLKNVKTYSTPDVWSAVLQELLHYKTKGSHPVLLVRAGAYMEFDPGDLLRFHKESEATVTRASDDNGPLDLWVVDPSVLTETNDLRGRLQAAKASYHVRGYVNRLQHWQDIRRLVVDGLGGTCGFRPRGSEIRPGVWIADGAEVKRGARIIALAFIGRDVRISDQCLITRCSNIESNSHIDHGTLVDDSSVLSNTYVGIGLDVSHSVADGGFLRNLRHGVTLEIADPVVMRSMQHTRVHGKGSHGLIPHFRCTDTSISATREIMR